MKYENSVFPQQKLSSKYKTEEWGERCVDYVVGMFESNGGSGRANDFDEMQKNYDLYLGIFDEKDLKYVTDPFDQADGFPAMTHNMNIIKPKIDLLVGEETKRPLRFNAVRTSQNAISDVQERMKSMLVDYILATSMASYSEEEKQKYIQMMNNGEIMPPAKILSFIENDYKDVAESSAYHSLRYLTEKLSMQNEFNKGFSDLLKSATEVHYVAVSNGEPYSERVDPRYFAYDRSPDLEYIEDGDWAARKMILSYTEAYDRLYDKIDEKKLDKLLEMSGATPGGNKYGKDAPAFDYNHVEFKTVRGNGDKSFLDKNTIVVYHATWKSYKKVGFVDYLDQNGEMQSEVVSENYMATGMEISIKWDWIIETWEGYRLGDDLYAGIAPVEYQHVSAENPNSQKLPYFGTTINEGKSLVSILKPLQYMYIIIWYRLELALARDKGRIFTMDITQIPKSMNIDPAKWLHYISSLGINFVNPYECFAKGTGVIMANGIVKNIEDIGVGEFVMGIDGSPRKVLSGHNGIDNMYRIKHRSGAKDQVVNSSHKIHYYERNYFKDKFDEKLANAIELINEEDDASYKSNIRYTKRASNVDSSWNSELNLDPYLLGVWLGDGTKNKVEITSIDSEIASYLSGYAEENGLKFSESSYKSDSDVKQYRIFNGAGIANPIKDALISYGIFNEKRIPKDFIYTSRENRLQLLAGLIDTDGCYHKRDGIYTFSQSIDKSHIVDDAAFIARSLGFKCTVNTYGVNHEKYILDNDNISICQPTRSLSILDWDVEIPVKIERKKAKVSSKRGDKDYSNFKIEYDGVGEFYGIHIDGDHLFLLDDFTIVHNTGWDTPGREGGRPSQFNQMTASDMSMTNTIGQYIDIMNKLEDMISELSGVSAQRQGSISSNELVGNVERSVQQSSYITEYIFWAHNQVKKNVLRALVNTAKEAWRDSSKTHLQYILNDASRAFITLSEDFFYEDFDIFISDSTKDSQDLQMIKSLYQPAMQNGASILDIAEIMTLDNISEIKTKLKQIEKRRAEMEQQAADAENQRQAQLIELQNQAKAEEMAIRQAELELDKYKIDADNNAKIAVAEIGAYKYQENIDQDGDGMPDPIEIANMRIKDAEVNANIEDRRMQLSAKQSEAQNKANLESRKIDKSAEIENKKIKLEEKKLSTQLELQKIKDKAALQRERIKASTALRNKTTGEK